MDRLTYMHKENVFKPNGERAYTTDRGWWLNGLDWYAICENACPLYDSDAECEPECGLDCPLRLAFAKLAAYENTGLTPAEITERDVIFRVYRSVCAGLTPEEVSEVAQAKREGRVVSRWCAFSGAYDCPLRNVKDVYCKESLLKGYCPRKQTATLEAAEAALGEGDKG